MLFFEKDKRVRLNKRFFFNFAFSLYVGWTSVFSHSLFRKEHECHRCCSILLLNGCSCGNKQVFADRFWRASIEASDFINVYQICGVSFCQYFLVSDLFGSLNFHFILVDEHMLAPTKIMWITALHFGKWFWKTVLYWGHQCEQCWTILETPFVGDVWSFFRFDFCTRNFAMIELTIDMSFEKTLEFFFGGAKSFPVFVFACSEQILRQGGQSGATLVSKKNIAPWAHEYQSHHLGIFHLLKVPHAMKLGLQC